MRLRSLAVSLAVVGPVLAQGVPESEPNDAAATASTIPCNDEGYGHLSPADVDYWRFGLTETQDVTVYITSRGATATSAGGTSVEDTTCVLYAADGATVLAANDDYVGRPASQRGSFSKVFVGAVPAGSYFVRVAGWNANDNGDYAIDVLCQPPVPPPAACPGFSPGAGEAEPNDDPFTANTANCCETIGGSVAAPGDEDWFAFALANDSEVTFDVTPTGFLTPLSDSQVWLYADDGSTLIAWDDDSGAGFDASLSLPLAAGSYFVKVRGFGSNWGEYSLRTNCATLAGGVPVLADWSVDSTGCVGTGGEELRFAPRLNEWPRIGSSFTLEMAGVVSNAVVMMAINPYDPAIDLGILGAPGCLLSIDPTVSIPAIPSVPGEHQLSVDILFDPFQIGGVVFMQAISLDPGATALGITTSDRLRIVIGGDA